MSKARYRLETLGLVLSIGIAGGCGECDRSVLAQGSSNSSELAEGLLTTTEANESVAVVVDPSQELVWVRCEQGMEYLPSVDWCNGKHADFEYCSRQDNSCNGEDDQGDLTGEGVSAVFESCFRLNEQGGFAGYDNWRVPTVDELSGLFFGLYEEAAEEFPNTRRSWYWSSTSDSNRNALFVSYESGEVGSYSKLGRYPVRCVSEL